MNVRRIVARFLALELGAALIALAESAVGLTLLESVRLTSRTFGWGVTLPATVGLGGVAAYLVKVAWPMVRSLWWLGAPAALG